MIVRRCAVLLGQGPRFGAAGRVHEPMDISLDLVVDAARRRLAALTPEVAGYIVLLATRQLEARPSQLSLASLSLTETGDIDARPVAAAPESEVEARLRELLAILLRSSPSPAPAITAVAEQAAGSGLRELAHELSAALIPINHAAARRALARLYRETQRAHGVAVASLAPSLVPDEVPASTESEDAAELTPDLFDTPPMPDETSANLRELTDETTPVLGTVAPALDSPEPPAASLPEVAPYFRAEEMREIEVEVELDAEAFRELASPRELPLVEPRRLSGPPFPAATARATTGDCRSDVQALLHDYLSHTRSEERMRQTLRAMVGLDPGVLRVDDGRPNVAS